MKEGSHIVYLHINKINKKVYVGITHHTDNPNRRWIGGKGYRKNSIIAKAVKKYGWDNFNHVIFCRTSKEVACLLEKVLIHHYKSKGLSYNIGLGGEGAESFSEETKAKLRQYTPWIKGRHHTEEAINKIRQAGRRPCYESTKAKLREYRLGVHRDVPRSIIMKMRQANIKPVLQFDLNDNFIKEYESATEAEKALGKSSHHIICCCRGNRKTTYGYKWRYKYE